MQKRQSYRSFKRPKPRPNRSAARTPAVAKPPKRPAVVEAWKVPVHIRATGSDLARVDRDYIRHKLGVRLRKHERSIERVSVRLEDVNGPRGGVDQACRIKVVLDALSSVVFESRDAALRAAFDAAVSGAERGVRRALGRRRMKPLRRGA